MRKYAFAVAACASLLAAAYPALAAKGTGCDGFLWPLTTEIAWLQTANSEKLASGSKLPAPPADKAIEVALLPASQVKFVTQPTSTPKPEDASAFGGVVNFDNIEAGQYQVTLSVHGWIDVIQNGAALEAIGFTGSDNCDAIGKSVRFEIGSGPFSIQLNGIRKDTLKLTVRPAAD
ncbi:hypothetical protein [Hyphomicrobium sp. LHD-15]|uniref:hypothetical protein n=1 Tax=Hyphomicrobium sp. LHD-15 TaxID=3072142 RepID=UPI00280CAFF9|nr:hypothetical protein [Hyphomicrobium sp. LHD-15]MDQ8699612.1 hypothetical protein [Hyphomicrobium sp. LHD-15]